MTTPNDIILQALKKAGVLGIGQQALAEDVNDAFNDLNDMLAQWQRKRWLVYHLVDYSIVSTGAQTYSVGPGGDINMLQRPDKPLSAFFRQLNNSSPNNPVDYPLNIIEAREDYNNITLKKLTTFPEFIFYDAGYPLGTLYPWPVIQSGIYELHVTFPEQLNQFTSLTQTVALPLEYFAALKFNLALRIKASYPGLPDNPVIIALAKDSLNVIRKANAQIPLLRMPTELRRRGLYNIYSDMNY